MFSAPIKKIKLCKIKTRCSISIKTQRRIQDFLSCFKFWLFLHLSPPVRPRRCIVRIIDGQVMGGLILFFNTQPAHDIRTTLYRRCYDVKALKRRRYNVVLTSCAGWASNRPDKKSDNISDCDAIRALLCFFVLELIKTTFYFTFVFDKNNLNDWYRPKLLPFAD